MVMLMIVGYKLSALDEKEDSGSTTGTCRLDYHHQVLMVMMKVDRLSVNDGDSDNNNSDLGSREWDLYGIINFHN